MREHVHVMRMHEGLVEHFFVFQHQARIRHRFQHFGPEEYALRVELGHIIEAAEGDITAPQGRGRQGRRGVVQW